MFGIEGIVYIEFVVDKNGMLTNLKTLKGIGEGCDEEAIKIIQNSGEWTPAKANGENVSQKLVLPVTFILNTDSTKTE